MSTQTKEITVEEGKLVMIRLETNFGYSNTWWRVMFIDNDNTFIGKLERHHWHEYTEHKKDDTQVFTIDEVQSVYNDGEQFCYSDSITICNCAGLCKNK